MRRLVLASVFLLAIGVLVVGGQALPAADAQVPPQATNQDQDGSQDVSVGDVLTYTITARNSGGITLTNVVVSDQLSGDTATCPTVAPSATCILNATYTVTPADVAAGQVSTTATADSNETGPVPLDTPATIRIPSPSLSVDKPAPANADDDASGTVSEGDLLTYTITATNAGSANLTGVVVSDNRILRTGGTSPCGLVPPGSTCTFTGTYRVTAADVTAGQIANTATADSVQAGPVQDSQTVSVAAAPAPAPTATPSPEVASIEIVSPEVTTFGMVEAGVDGVASPGDGINYSLTIANTGNVTLTNIVVNDAAGGIIDCVIGTLEPGQADDSTCTGSYPLTQADIDAGEVENEATVTAVAPNGVQAQDTATIRLDVPQDPALELVRTGRLDLGADGIATPGDVIQFSFRVENSGNVTLDDVSLTDEGIGVAACAVGTLAPAASDSTTCAGSHTLTQADIDSGIVGGPAVAEGRYTGGTVTARTDAEAGAGVSIPQNPALGVVRVLDANADEDGSSSVSLDDSLTFVVTATNLGNIGLTNVKVGEDLTGDENACAALAPAATCVLTLPYAVSQANVDQGGVPNLAYASSDQTGEVRPTDAPVDQVAAAQVNLPSNFLTGLTGWSGFSTDAAVIGTNLSLALLALVTLLVATTVFNSTLEENAASVEAAMVRVSNSQQFAPVLAALGWMTAEQAGVAGRWLRVIKPTVIILITAFIYALLEPGFGWNDETLVVVVALVAGIAAATLLYEGGQILWATKHYDTPGAMRLYPLAILIAVACVALTRVTNLHPGVIFGFVTAAALFPRAEMTRDAQGKIIALPLALLMLVSLIAFTLIDPLHDFSVDHPSVWGTLPETIAVAVFVGGAQSALLILIPVTFNDGEKIWAWNKLIWFALALPAAFAFFHVLVNDDEFGEIVESTNGMTLIVICVAVLVVSAATWLFFRLHNRPRPA